MNTHVNKSYIIKELGNILNKLFDLDITAIGEGYENEHLLGMKIRLVSSDLVYILLETERLFKIRIPQEEIVAGRFDTVNNIADIIDRQLEIKQDKKIV